MRRQGGRDPRDPRVRVEAAVTLANSRPRKDEALELAAFMAIFHPGHPHTDELVREKRMEQRKESG